MNFKPFTYINTYLTNAAFACHKKAEKQGGKEPQPSMRDKDERETKKVE